jgi:hypothetical protein
MGAFCRFVYLGLSSGFRVSKGLVMGWSKLCLFLVHASDLSHSALKKSMPVFHQFEYRWGHLLSMARLDVFFGVYYFNFFSMAHSFWGEF